MESSLAHLPIFYSLISLHVATYSPMYFSRPIFSMHGSHILAIYSILLKLKLCVSSIFIQTGQILLSSITDKSKEQ